MAKMSEVHAELEELGWYKVNKIEAFIELEKLGGTARSNIIKKLYDMYCITANTAIMLIAGSKEHRCSSMLKDRELEDER